MQNVVYETTKNGWMETCNHLVATCQLVDTIVDVLLHVSNLSISQGYLQVKTDYIIGFLICVVDSYMYIKVVSNTFIKHVKSSL